MWRILGIFTQPLNSYQNLVVLIYIRYFLAEFFEFLLFEFELSLIVSKLSEIFLNPNKFS